MIDPITAAAATKAYAGSEPLSRPVKALGHVSGRGSLARPCFGRVICKPTPQEKNQSVQGDGV